MWCLCVYNIHPKCVHVCIYTHTHYIHTYIHIYTHTYIYTHILGVYMYTHTHNGILLSHKKEGNSAICNNLEGIMLSEISQIEKDKYYILSLIRGIKK